MGLINVGFLLFFVYSAYKLVAGSGSPAIASIKGNLSSVRPEIRQEIAEQAREEKTLTRQVWPLTRQEIKTVNDMEEALAAVQHLIEQSDNRLGKADREKMVNLLKQLIKGENVLKSDLVRINKLLSGFSNLDEKDLDQKRKRLKGAKGDERQVLWAEIQKQEIKIQADKAITGYERQLVQAIQGFQEALKGVITILSHSPYPLDAKPVLAKARTTLGSIRETISRIAHVEAKLSEFTKEERRRLRTERVVARS